jgi:hypothetical protein
MRLAYLTTFFTTKMNRLRYLEIQRLILLLPPLATIILGLSSNDTSAAGAATPFTTLEAEAGALGGGATVISFTPGSAVPTVPTQELEASGMAYVLLTNLNDSVSWTNPVAGANAMVIRSCIPDAPNGGGITATLDLYVDGVFRQAVTLSSRQSWNYRGVATTNQDNPHSGGTPWHFWNEDHTFITSPVIAAGSVIKLQKGPTNTASYYKIDCVDMENVPPPLAQPANSLSVVAYGADPTDTTDSMTAIQNCINDAETQHKIVWLPQGTFMVNNLKSGSFSMNNVTIAGAGMWYSIISRNVPVTQLTNGNWRSTMSINTNTVLQDFAIDSNGIYRGGGGADYASGAVGTNWLIQRVWARHCGPFWLGGSYSTIRDCRVSDSWADGINLNDGNSPNVQSQGISLTTSNDFVRGCGDDGLSTYSDAGSSGLNYQMQGTHIVNSTSMATYWANGLRIAGGTNVVVQGDLIDSVSANNGIEISVYGGTGHPLDSALVSGNVILRAGGWNGTNRNGIDVGAPGSGSLFSNAVTRATIANNDDRLALRAGLSIGQLNEAMTVTNNIFDQPALLGIRIQSGVIGSGYFGYNVVTNLTPGQNAFENDSVAAFITTLTNNSWQPPVCLSQGRPVTASSYQTGYSPTNGNDSNLTTRWSASTTTFPQWWQVDLGSTQNLTGVTIDWYNSSSRGYGYQIAVSTNNVNFTTVVDKSVNATFGNTTDYFPALARYVKVTVTSCTQSGGYAGFYECLAYGIATNPTNITGVTSGNTLALSWPADHRGWHLQVQTNLPGTGLGTNWVTVPGAEVITGTNITIDHASGSAFYRLTY